MGPQGIYLREFESRKTRMEDLSRPVWSTLLFLGQNYDRRRVVRDDLHESP